ncbi:MAG: type II toxin-antitoxin system HipA family toxin [Proteobacteria bacterium]|nr:type II toxin-antitoxin system HipA family toxin [Pseudomonadota bacterium]MBU1387526.1 type II toxin-antitoxin system HipA family toxin [Pseudomonadota bacterium]MBU1544001.1 type II toxin-antitoxin system HipA family toxin [Pseudomonadota bacterium]MBU2430533.1 type II toxin-antitoxin system HipA family toxin [Pseudomonadota bacterium]
MTSEQKAIVYIFLPKDGYVPAGTLEHFPLEKRSVFQYGKKYLNRPNALPMDPVKIPLRDLIFETSMGQPVFNIFRDAAPDRWGRHILSIAAGTKAQAMTEFDILTALGPENRVGALAFGPDPYSGPRANATWYQKNPFEKPAVSLKDIARYARRADQIDDDDMDDVKKDLAEDDLFKFFVPSLSPAGGARPKAIIRHDNQDWIAKFPKRGDIWNEPLIEHACMTLANTCGITVPETQIIKEEAIDILLIKRFDKDKFGNPLHMASGFTIADLFEDQPWGSYQDLANAARRYGAASVGEQLFKRMIFNICCANTDDHPRNHAFFIHREKIDLTPAYDIVPCRYRFKEYNLALNIGTHGRQATLENALSNTGPFGLSKQEGMHIILKIRNTFNCWPDHFKKAGVSTKDMEELQLRFSHSGTELKI